MTLIQLSARLLKIKFKKPNLEIDWAFLSVVYGWWFVVGFQFANYFHNLIPPSGARGPSQSCHPARISHKPLPQFTSTILTHNLVPPSGARGLHNPKTFSYLRNVFKKDFFFNIFSFVFYL
mgnify:CR=1 FL=1